MIDPAEVAANVADVRRRIHAAGGGDEVRILAVTKTFPLDAARGALAAGCTAVGENYAQETVAKWAEWQPDEARPSLHFIGHVQTNKVRMLAPIVEVWQTLDRPSVIDEVARRAPGARAYLQVNVTGEPSKSGCEPSDASALLGQARSAGLRIEGLMTLGAAGDEAVTLAGFRLLSSIADELGLAERSMGMSGDLELAVQAGATMVRIGSALFGPRAVSQH